MKVIQRMVNKLRESENFLEARKGATRTNRVDHHHRLRALRLQNHPLNNLQRSQMFDGARCLVMHFRVPTIVPCGAR